MLLPGGDFVLPEAEPDEDAAEGETEDVEVDEADDDADEEFLLVSDWSL